MTHQRFTFKTYISFLSVCFSHEHKFQINNMRQRKKKIDLFYICCVSSTLFARRRFNSNVCLSTFAVRHKAPPNQGEKQTC